MPNLLRAALGLFLESQCKLIYLDEPMFSDPIVPAKHAELFQTLHILYCCDTGADPAFYNIRNIVNWLGKAEDIKSKAASA